MLTKLLKKLDKYIAVASGHCSANGTSGGSGHCSAKY